LGLPVGSPVKSMDGMRRQHTTSWKIHELLTHTLFEDNELRNIPSSTHHTRKMRRPTAFAVLLFLFSSWGAPFLSALTGHSEDNLSACCRRNGKHHCMMSLAERRQLAGRYRQFDSPAEKCPYAPAAVVAVHSEPFVIPVTESAFSALFDEAATVAQSRSLLHIGEKSSLRKRGPPFQHLF